jgi:hypothetical protein
VDDRQAWYHRKTRRQAFWHRSFNRPHRHGRDHHPIAEIACGSHVDRGAACYWRFSGLFADSRILDGSARHSSPVARPAHRASDEATVFRLVAEEAEARPLIMRRGLRSNRRRRQSVLLPAG